MTQQVFEMRTRRSKGVLVLAIIFALAMMMVLGSASSAFALHKAIKDTGTLDGTNAATTLLINSASNKDEGFQFGTYEDPYGDLKINEKEVGAYSSRDCFIKNKTDYLVELILWGVAQTNYKNFEWEWFSSDQSAASVKSEGTKNVELMHTILYPEQQIYVRAVATKKSSVRLALKAQYHYYGKVPGEQYKTTVSAVKLSGKQVQVIAEASGAANKTKIDLYMNDKKVKTVSKKNTLTYTATGSSATKAKYYAVATTIGKSDDSAKSETVKPVANVKTIRVSMDLKTYGAGTCTFKPSKLFYSGGKLVIEGYTVNKSNMSNPMGFYVEGICNGKTFFKLDKEDYVLKPGIKKATFKVKAKKIKNLVASDISFIDMD